MYNWAVIENNTITEYHYSVPNNWRHVSNLAASASDLDFMRGLGWWPIEKQDIEYDESTHEIADYQYQLDSNKVVAHPRLREKSQPAPSSSSEDHPQIDLVKLQAQLDLYKATVDSDVMQALAEKIALQHQELVANMAQDLTVYIKQKYRLIDDPDLQKLPDLILDKLLHDLSAQVRDTMTMRTAVNWEDAWKHWFKAETERLSTQNAVDFADQKKDLLQDLQSLKDHLGHLINHVDPFISVKNIGEAVRAERNLKLARTDWTQLSDVQARMSQAERDKWANYRQALRDLPSTNEDPNLWKWPVI